MPSPKSKPKPKRNAELTFKAIGTSWHITLYDQEQVAPSLLKAISQRIEAFDKDYSRFRADSLITAMSKKAGTYTLPSDAQPLFDLYQELYDLTDGAMTPLIGQTLVEAGYDSQYSLLPKTLHQPQAWQEALAYDYPKLTLHKPVLLDVGAAGKGYLVDLIGELLEAAGITQYCVDAGGDMRLRHSGRALTIGLEDPEDPAQVVGSVELSNQSLCGSAGNRRRWATFNHILDPHSLDSPQHILAIWVIADSTLLADGLTTSLYFSSPTRLHKQYTFEHAILYADHTIDASARFAASFFTEQTRA